MTNVAEAWVTLRPDLSKFGPETEAALKKLGGRLNDAGRALTVGLTAPILGLGVAAGKAFIDFESAFAGVRKTVDATETQFASLRQGIRDMAKEVPASATSIAAVAEAAGQLGIQADAILDFTRVMIDLGETTNLEATEAASALAQFANITQLSQEEFDRLGSVIVDLGNKMATTERDIVEFGLRIAGAGEIAGLTEAQILAIGAAMASVGVEAEAGGTAIQKVLLAMVQAVAEGGDELRIFAATAGASIAEFERLFREDAAGAFVAFVEGLQRAGDDAFKVLERLGLQDQRLIRGLLSLAEAEGLLPEAIAQATDAWAENIALTEEAEKRYQTTASRIKIALNELVDGLIELGEAGQPFIDRAIQIARVGIDAFAGLARAFATLSPGIQTAIVLGAAFLASLGPLLVVVGSVASGIGALAALAPVLGAAFAALAGPIGVAALALAAVAAGFALMSTDSASLPTELLKVKIALLEIGAGAERALKPVSDLFSKLEDIATLGGSVNLGKVADFLTTKREDVDIPILSDISRFLQNLPGARPPSAGGTGGGTVGAVPFEGVGDLRSTIQRELDEALFELNKRLNETTGATNEQTDALSKTKEEIEALIRKFLGGEGLESALGSTGDTASLLADGIITLREAIENGLSAAQAGALEAQHFLETEASGAQERLFILGKTIAGLQTAAAAGESAFASFVQHITTQALQLQRAAAQAIFARPTREQLNLQLQIAQLESAIAARPISAGPTTKAGSDSKQEAAARASENAQKRAAAAIDAIRDRAARAAEALNRFEVKLTDGAQALGRAISSIFGRFTREEGGVQLQIAQVDQEIAAIRARGGEVPETLQRRRDALQADLELMEAHNRVQQLQLQLADETLLTEQQQNQRFQELLQNAGRLSTTVLQSSEEIDAQTRAIQASADRFSELASKTSEQEVATVEVKDALVEQRDALQRQLEQIERQHEIDRISLQLADETLLSERELKTMVDILRGNIEDLSRDVRAAADITGDSMVPEFDAAVRAADGVTGAFDTLGRAALGLSGILSRSRALPRGSGRAEGGDVWPGMLFPVGERGMELFEPRVPGRIIPNSEITNNSRRLQVFGDIHNYFGGGPRQPDRNIDALALMRI